MVETQTPWVGDGLYVRRPWERDTNAILSLFDTPGGVTFSYLVIIKSMTHTHVFSNRLYFTNLIFQTSFQIFVFFPIWSKNNFIVFYRTIFFFDSFFNFCFVEMYTETPRSRKRKLQSWSDAQETKVPECMWSWWAWAWGGYYVHVWVRSVGTERVQTGENYLGCHIHVNTLVSRRNQPEPGGCDDDNQWTCVHVWASSIGTEKVQAGESYLGCHIHVDALVSRRSQEEENIFVLHRRNPHKLETPWISQNKSISCLSPSYYET